MNVYPSAPDATGLRFAIVVSRFNHLISVALLDGARETLVGRGAQDDAIDVAWVPGAFEIPMAAGALARTGRYAAIVTLGSVIRGGTPHFEYVCAGVTDGVRVVMETTGVPVAFGVLTTDDVEQALARAGGSEGNKGVEAALAAIEMATFLPLLGDAPPVDGGAGAPRNASTRRGVAARRGAAARTGRKAKSAKAKGGKPKQAGNAKAKRAKARKPKQAKARRTRRGGRA